MDKKEVLVKLKNINKYFEDDNSHIVKDLDLDVYEGEFLTLLGSSGCGKTTTLRMIAGFVTPTSGSIEIKGENIIDKEPYERNINTVFQNYALFPHMNIYDNIAFGLKMKKISKAEIKEKVMEILELVQLTGFEKRFPQQLSGGQKQRVAIARALVNNPQVLLLDEPLAALDLKLRKQMQLELKRIQKKLGITFIYVTHDQEEALTMSDRIVIMNDGRIVQSGTPDEIYEKPNCKFAATFIGETNLFEAKVLSIKDNYVNLQTQNGNIFAKGCEYFLGEKLYVSVRPEKTRYSLEPVENFSMEATVKENIYAGSFVKTICVLNNGQELKIQRLNGKISLEPSQKVYIHWENPQDAVIMKLMENENFDWEEN